MKERIRNSTRVQLENTTGWTWKWMILRWKKKKDNWKNRTQPKSSAAQQLLLLWTNLHACLLLHTSLSISLLSVQKEISRERREKIPYAHILTNSHGCMMYKFPKTQRSTVALSLLCATYKHKNPNPFKGGEVCSKINKDMNE